MFCTRSQSRLRGAGGTRRPSGPRRSCPSSSTGCPASLTGRPMSSTGCPSAARSGNPRESIRGRPLGCGQEAVVKMWPQKWKASDSPGSIRFPTVRAPVSAISAPPTLARKPRREVSRARPSVIRSRCSGTGRLDPSAGGGEHALELRQVIVGALGEHGAVAVEGEREGAAGDLEAAPEGGLGDLIETGDGDPGVLGDVVDRGRERLADVAALGGEDREPEVGPVSCDAV